MTCGKFIKIVRKLLEPKQIEIIDWASGDGRFVLVLHPQQELTAAEKMKYGFQLQEHTPVGIKLVVNWDIGGSDGK